MLFPYGEMVVDLTRFVCVTTKGTTWMSHEVSTWLGSVGYNPNIHHL